nr:hypothetical protein [Mycoplasmopsis bovis]
MSKYIPFSNIWATKGLIEITFCTNIKISVTISEALEADWINISIDTWTKIDAWA